MNFKIKYVTTFYLGFAFFVYNYSIAKIINRDSTSQVKYSSISSNFTSRGLGLELNLKLRTTDKYSLRINAAYLPFTKQQSIKMDKGTSVDIFPKIETLTAGFLMDYHPLKKRIFRMTGGLSYDILQQYDLSFSSASGLNLGGLQISNEDFGKVKLGIKWNALRPYFGVGFGKPDMTTKIGFGFDMGVSYMGSPKLNLVYDGFLETTTIDDEMKKIEENMKGYRYYPYIAFQVKYRLGSKIK